MNPQWKVESAHNLQTYKDAIEAIQAQGGEIRMIQFQDGAWIITYVVAVPMEAAKRH